MAHTRKQQGQFRKIIKDYDQIKSETLDPPSVSSNLIPSSSSCTSSLSSLPSVPTPSSTSLPSVPSSTSISSTPVIPIPDDQFKKFMSKMCGDMYINMYKNMYGQLYNNIKFEILATLPESKSSDKVIASANKRIKSKNTKKHKQMIKMMMMIMKMNKL